jgi:hypothetical protein
MQVAKNAVFSFYYYFWWLFYDQLSDSCTFWLRIHLNSCCFLQECSKEIKLHMRIALCMFDQQKLRGSVYDQGEWNSDDFKKINKTHFKMRVGTNGFSFSFFDYFYSLSHVFLQKPHTHAYNRRKKTFIFVPHANPMPFFVLKTKTKNVFSLRF